MASPEFPNVTAIAKADVGSVTLECSELSGSVKFEGCYRATGVHCGENP